jgi:hypothetical protein
MTGKTTLSQKDLSARRRAEIVESLWRISVGVEALHQQGERRLRATSSLEAKVESALQYFVRAWQGVRGERVVPHASEDSR